jgi:signal transduction histidine kinase
MKLSTKGTLWAIAILAVIAVNSLLTIFAVHELRLTNRITAQDYEVALELRSLRSILGEYYVYGLDAGRKDATDLERIMFAKAKQQITVILDRDSTAISSPELIPAINAAKKEIQSLLMFKPHTVQSKPDAISLLNPVFRKRFEIVSNHLNNLANQSALIVETDRNRNTTLAEWLTFTAIGMFLLAVMIAAGRLIFLRQTILVPIQSLVETLKKVRHGDLTARWNTERQDEIGVMGKTINETVAELEQRRIERIRIVSSITHDLKNPLTAISMSCDFLLRKGTEASKENALSLVRNIRTQVDRLKRMIEDLLGAVSALRPGLDLKINKINLSKLTADTVELFQNAHPDRRYSLLQTKESSPVEILADQDRIAQALTNLISNATKYSLPGTAIDLTITCERDVAVLEVSDRGIGIPEDKVAEIFQPFSRLEQGRKMNAGLGLGLATVKNIVDAHLGTISAHPRSGGGTVFRLVLPIKGPEHSLMAG